MIYKRELKLIDTEEKAYLFGFLYGDGCITEYKEGERIRFQTRISIHEKDKKLIIRLKKLFSFFSVGEYDYGKHNKNSGKQYSIRSSSKELFDDLKSNGLFTKKSYQNKEKLKLPFIDMTLMPHFIRGFFDADGSVFKMKYRKNLIKVEITSNSKSFIYDLNNYLNNNDIHSWKILEKKPTGKGKEPYYVISIIKTNEIIKFKNFIYNNATIFLERKKEIFDLYRVINKVKDRMINCHNCGGLNTKRNGMRNNKIRMKCSDCQKGFTLK